MFTFNRHSKFMLIWVLAFMSALAPLATDMYLPALTEVQNAFNTTESLTQLSIASFFIAFSFGQLVYGPLSDAFGRKKPLYIGTLLYVFASIACVSVDSIYAFIFFRFIQALGGCSGVVIARAIINDKFDVKEGAAVLAIMMMVGALAPMLAPTLGGVVLEYLSWKFIFWLLFIFGFILFFMIIIFLPETSKEEYRIKFNLPSIIDNYISILKDRRFVIYVLSFSCTLACIFVYITGSSFVFREHFGLSAQKFGLVFGLNALGGTISSIINARLVRTYSPYNILQIAFFFMMVFAVLLIISGVFALPFLLFEIFLFATMSMIGFIAPNITVLAMSRFKKKSGSASAVLGTTQFAIAGFASFMVSILGANHPAPLSILIGICPVSGYFIYLLINKRNIRKLKKKIGLL